MPGSVVPLAMFGLCLLTEVPTDSVCSGLVQPYISYSPSYFLQQLLSLSFVLPSNPQHALLSLKLTVYKGQKNKLVVMDQDLIDDDFSETGVNVGVLLGGKTIKEKNQ